MDYIDFLHLSVARVWASRSVWSSDEIAQVHTDHSGLAGKLVPFFADTIAWDTNNNFYYY